MSGPGAPAMLQGSHGPFPASKPAPKHPGRPALAKTRTTRQPPALVTESLQLLEDAMGGREALVAALSAAPKSADLDYVLGLLGDPATQQTALAVLCAQGGITPGELVTAYKAGILHGAQALATKAVAAQLPQIAADTARRALPHLVVCSTCHGTTQVANQDAKGHPLPGTHACEACGATGQQQRDGDLDHKKLALELGQMTAKGGGLTVAVTNQVGVQVGTVGGSLERMQAATDAILYGGDPLEAVSGVVDAEVVEENEAPSLDAEVETDWQGHPLA